MRMIAIEIEVVFMLRNRASSATGEAIARHAFSLAVHSRRLAKGRLIKPASSASATTASPEASASPPLARRKGRPSLPHLRPPPRRTPPPRGRARRRPWHAVRAVRLCPTSSRCWLEPPLLEHALALLARYQIHPLPRPATLLRALSRASRGG